jgi:hypothetical protein
MSNFVNLDSKDSDLTAYSVDGLELFFTPDRKVRASQSAIARMCNTHQAGIRQFIMKMAEKGEIKVDVIHANIVAGSRLQGHLLYDSIVISKCMAKYNPSRLADFQDFGLNEGLAQMAGVPLPATILATSTSPMVSSAEQLMVLAKAAIDLATLQIAAQSNPGDKRQMEMTLEAGTNTLEGHESIFEMAEALDMKMTPELSRAIGMIMAGAVKARKENKTCPKVRRRTVNDKGNCQSYLVNTYPTSMRSTFISAYTACNSI